MPEPLPNLRVAMRRPDLDQLPPVVLPAGHALRDYLPVSEAAWLAIHQVADPWHTFTAAFFAQQFGTDAALLAARQLYLCAADGNPIGTSTAWFVDAPDQPCGRVHWVAIRPEQQGRGLGRPLLVATLRRLRELGHRSALLTTSTARLPALRLYLRHGFVPETTTPEARTAWLAILPHLPQLAQYP